MNAIQKTFYIRNLMSMLLKHIYFFSLWILLFPPIWHYYKLMNYKLGIDKYISLFHQSSFNYEPYFLFIKALVITNIVITVFQVCFYIITCIVFVIKNTSPSKHAYRNTNEYATLSARITLISILKKFRLSTQILWVILSSLSLIPMIIVLYHEFNITLSFISCFISICILVIMEMFFPFVLFILINKFLSHEISNQLHKHAYTLSPSAQSFNKLIGIDFDQLNGYDFEEYCAILLAKHGFEHVSVTKRSNDYGVDIIAFFNGCKVAIQCKRYQHTVGNSAIQEVVAGMNYYRCQQAIVITNNYFTKSATHLAKANNVILWDRETLQAKMYEATLVPDEQ